MVADLVQPSRPEYSAFTTLVTKHALAVFREKLRDWDTHLREIKADATRTDFYPDGTLLIEAGDSVTKLRNLIIRKQLIASGGIWEGVGFASLEPFPEKPYALWYTTNYRESLGELSFTIAFPRMHTHPTRDYRIGDLQITVVFKKKPTAEVRNRFACYLSDWFQSVGTAGMFGEGPIKKASHEVQFRGRLAQFRLNASRSGQDTLNWLLLSVLNFGYEVSAVQEFIFDHEAQLEIFVGPLVQQIVTVPIITH